MKHAVLSLAALLLAPLAALHATASEPASKPNIIIVGGNRWVDTCVPSEKWRLLNNGKSLFDVTSDAHQDTDLATQNAGILKDLNSYYDAWYQQAYAEFRNARYIHLGHQNVPEVILYASDWNGDSCDNPGHLALGAGKGRWDIEVETAGDYRVELSRWPFESGKALTEGAKGATDSGGARPIAKAQLTVASYNQTIDTKPGDKSAAFTPHLKASKTTLTANFLDRDEKILCGAFYVRVTRLTE